MNRQAPLANGEATSRDFWMVRSLMFPVPEGHLAEGT